MEYTKLGNTGMDVSPICLGCMSFGSAVGWGQTLRPQRCVRKHGLKQSKPSAGDNSRSSSADRLNHLLAPLQPTP